MLQYLIGCLMALVSVLAVLLVGWLLHLAAGARRRRKNEKRYRQ